MRKLYKSVALFLTITLIGGQAFALGPSLASDPDINPSRSIRVRNDVSHDAEPGAIGNGAPLEELAQGKSPARITLPEDEYKIIEAKLRKAIAIAMQLCVAKNKNILSENKVRTGQAFNNLTDLQNSLKDRAYLFNADIRGPENYLLGFNAAGYRGFSVELIDLLYSVSPKRLAQYIFHECVPEEGFVTDRSDHRMVYREIQSAIFGPYEVLELRKDLRMFIIAKTKAIPTLTSGQFEPIRNEESKPPSILEAAEINMRKAAKTMGLDPKLLGMILQPKKVTSVKFVEQMDNGEKVTFHAFRALQNDALGPGKGGLRWLVGRCETLAEAKKTAVGLATLMSVKNAVIGIPYGGAKGDVFVEDKDYSDNEKALIIRGFSRELTKARAIGAFIDVPAPDKGTDSRMMAWFLDEHLKTLAKMGQIYDKTIETELKKVEGSENPQDTSYLDKYMELLVADKDGILQGFEVGMVTGKPIGKGGSEGRTKATGFGGFLALQAMLKHFGEIKDIGKDIIGRTLNENARAVLKKKLSEMTAAIQGAGNVAEYHAWELFRAGVKIELLEDAVKEGNEFVTYTLYNPNGIDIELLNKSLDRLPDGRWAPLKTARKEFFEATGCKLLRNNKNIFWQTHTNIKVPAATENVITMNNARDVNCEILLELANDPTTPQADEELKRRGILRIPDVLANVGGVTVSYYEWLQNIEGKYWAESTVDKMLEERINIETRTVLSFVEKYQVDLREAAYILYLARVADAMIAQSDELTKEFTDKEPYGYYGELGLFPATIEKLNRVIKEGKFGSLVNESEAAKSREIDDVVNKVTGKFTSGETGFVLISGPTTSGKLSLAVSLVDRLNALGKRAIRINFDKLTLEDLKDLREGREIEARDDIDGKEFTRKIVPQKGDIFVLEGNYTLADETLRVIPASNRFGIFVNTAPSMKLSDSWPLTSLDLRLLRHILTVHHTEGLGAIDVIRRWPAERREQLEHVYPTWVNADMTFNGYLAYELPIIKFHVEKLIDEASEAAIRDKDEASIKIIERLRRTLKDIISVESEDLIPEDSIIWQYMVGDSLYGRLLEGDSVQSGLMADISDAMPVRAKVFEANLKKILTENPDELFFVGVENTKGDKRPQLIYKAIDRIENMTDADGNRLFPNLMVKRGSAGKLISAVMGLKESGKLRLGNAFLCATAASVASKAYDMVEGEGGAWIAALDDSRDGDYLPVFEAITLNMMAYLKADLSAMKNFYDAISDYPIDPERLRDMIRGRMIYILPKATKFDPGQLRKLYELAQQVYLSA